MSITWIKKAKLSLLNFLANEFMHDIPDAILDNPVWKFMKNSFKINVITLPDPCKNRSSKQM
jgi:hypothetical protein